MAPRSQLIAGTTLLAEGGHNKRPGTNLLASKVVRITVRRSRYPSVSVITPRGYDVAFLHVDFRAIRPDDEQHRILLSFPQHEPVVPSGAKLSCRQGRLPYMALLRYFHS